MDAFLLALILAFAISLGGRDQRIVAQFSESLERSAPLLATGVFCAGLSAAAMAYAGAAIAGLLPRRAAEMLVAFALAAAAVELIWKVRIKPMKEPTRSYVAIGAVLFGRQIGDAARFVIFALAAWSVYPVTAAIGGALGGGLAIGLGWAVGLSRIEQWPLAWLRLALAICIFLAALMIGLNARYVFL